MTLDRLVDAFAGRVLAFDADAAEAYADIALRGSIAKSQSLLGNPII